MDVHPPSPRGGKDDLRSALELHYPHILEGLLKAWPSKEDTDGFLNHVLVDDRYNRSGLPEEVFAELMFLSDLNWKRMHFNQDGVQVSPDGFSFGKPF
jgi:hypothetical protein